MTRGSEPSKSDCRRVFVLRMWWEESGQNGRFRHRCILEDPFNKSRRGFASLEELTIFLETLPAPKQE